MRDNIMMHPMKVGFDVGEKWVELAQFRVQIAGFDIVGVKPPAYTTGEFAMLIIMIVIKM
jgi:glycine cleavage system protein P-like pyridoxal-binding family